MLVKYGAVSLLTEFVIINYRFRNEVPTVPTPRPATIRQAIREVLPREVCKGDWWASGSGYAGRY